MAKAIDDVLTIVQARMSSHRLPGKVLRPILGQPMLSLQLDRIERASLKGPVVVATSALAEDDRVADLCRSRGVRCFRGALNDVLGRFIGAVERFGPASHVVRLTADCPLTDWRIIDTCISRHLHEGADYTSNAIKRTFPDGLDVEVVSAPALFAAGRDARLAEDREHVLRFVYERPQQFKLVHVTQARDLSDLRWTVDTAGDLAFVTNVYEMLYPRNPAFTTEDILGLSLQRRASDAP